MRMRKSLRVLEWIGLAVILASATALRATRLDRGFWEDEAVEYVLGAARPLWGSLTYQPFPLYHVFAHVTLYFSEAEWVIRIPSLIAGIGGIAALYFVSRKFFGIAAAILAAFLMAVSTFHISTSTEARFYALVMLAAVLVFWALQSALVRNRWRDWLLYVVFGNLAAMSQIVLVPLVGSMAAAAACWVFYQDRSRHESLISPRLRNLVIASALCLAGVVLAALAGAYDLGRFVVSDSTDTLEGVLDDLGNPLASAETTRLTLSQYYGFFDDYIDGESGTLALLLIGLGLSGAIELGRRHPSAAVMVAAAITVPPLPFLFLDVTHFYHPRYFCGVLPFLLFLIAGGASALAAAAKWAVESLFNRFSINPKESLLRHVALYTAAALPFIVVLAQIVPVALQSLNSLYGGDYARGLHFEFAHDKTIRFLEEVAEPNDYAVTCVPRPDWLYYYRKNLMDHLNAPVDPDESFNLWYVGGMANCVNRSDLPTDATLAEVIEKDWLGGRQIFRYEVNAPNLRTLATEEDFTSPEAPLLAFEVKTEGQRTAFAAEPVPALPHRYVELVVEAEGPPQFALVLNYFDTTGRFLQNKILRMRDVRVQREPHPSGHTPPVAPSHDRFTIKLADTSPPLAASVSPQIVVEGDTRPGDSYTVHTATLRGNWDELRGRDLGFPRFSGDKGTRNWTILPRGAGVDGLSEARDPSEIKISAETDEPLIRLESPQFPIPPAQGSLQLEVPVSGNVELIHPSVLFFNARGDRLERVQLTSDPVYEWWSTRNMLVKPSGEKGWPTLIATIRVPTGAERIQLVFDSDEDAMEAAEPTNATLTLRSPRLYGFD